MTSCNGYETDLSAMIQDPHMPEKDRKFIEIFAHLGIFTMEKYIGDRFRVKTLQLDDLYLLQSCGDEDLENEIEQTQKHTDKLHKDFFRMYRFCEHLAKTYFHFDSRDLFISKLNQRVPIELDHEDEVESLLMNDFLDL